MDIFYELSEFNPNRWLQDKKKELGIKAAHRLFAMAAGNEGCVVMEWAATVSRSPLGRAAHENSAGRTKSLSPTVARRSQCAYFSGPRH
jgi:hypothetical protein